MSNSLRTQATSKTEIIPTPEKSNKKLRVLFYCAGLPLAGTKIWIYPTVLHLKTYLEYVYPEIADNIEWLIPIQVQVENQTLIDCIKEYDVDILCTSHYVWNHKFLLQQLHEIQDFITSNNMMVIAGGPSIDVNTDRDFFANNSAIDYAIYGPGEQAFADILYHIIEEKPLITFNTSNCAWVNKTNGRVYIADYKFVKMIDQSPYTSNQQLLTSMVEDLQKNSNLSIWLPYTVTRGCPYSCTFCDWNSGFGTKVSRRKNTYQQEIDLFHELGLTNIFLSDANTGQYDEDVDMIEYFAKKNIEKNAGFIVNGSYSKLRKANNLKIYRTMAKAKLMVKSFSLSVQDINIDILNNINRPDVGWDVHVSIANTIRQEHPDIVVRAQLLFALPGQTVASWKQTLETVVKENILPTVMLNEPLPASPAMLDPVYQERFQFIYKHSNRLTPNIKSDGFQPYLSLVPINSSSFNQSDIARMQVLGDIYTALTSINIAMQHHGLSQFDVVRVADMVLQSQQCENLYENLYNNWIEHNNFFYTIDFAQMQKNLTEMGHCLAKNMHFLKYVAQLLPKNQQANFFKISLSTSFLQMVTDHGEDID